VVSRRVLLAGGAAALLAGCGEAEDATPPAADALARSSEAERRFAAALQDDDEPRLAERAAERARRLGGGDGEAEGGDPLELGRAALIEHVAALPSLKARDDRSLMADVIVGVATDLAVLGDTFDHAFPGTPQ
jgi:hypothetical protein